MQEWREGGERKRERSHKSTSNLPVPSKSPVEPLNKRDAHSDRTCWLDLASLAHGCGLARSGAFTGERPLWRGRGGGGSEGRMSSHGGGGGGGGAAVYIRSQLDLGTERTKELRCSRGQRSLEPERTLVVCRAGLWPNRLLARQTRGQTHKLIF